MNIFEAVKEEVTTRAAADSYGIKIRYNGMAVCPFHDDRNPSMKVGDRYYCFGCQAKGDVIDFASNLFGLSPKMAAEKLAADFRIRYDTRFYRRSARNGYAYPDPNVSAKRAEMKALKEYKEQERRCFIVLCDYLHLLKHWKVRYAPKSSDEDWHPKFCEALQKLDHIEYLLDTLLYGGADERAEVVKKYAKEASELTKIS